MRFVPGALPWSLIDVLVEFQKKDPGNAGTMLGLIWNWGKDEAIRSHQASPWAKHSPYPYRPSELYDYVGYSDRGWRDVMDAYHEGDWSSIGICLYRIWMRPKYEVRRSHEARAWAKAKSIVHNGEGGFDLS